MHLFFPGLPNPSGSNCQPGFVLWFAAHVPAEPGGAAGDRRGWTAVLTPSLFLRWFSSDICHFERSVILFHASTFWVLNSICTDVDNCLGNYSEIVLILNFLTSRCIFSPQASGRSASTRWCSRRWFQSQWCCTTSACCWSTSAWFCLDPVGRERPTWLTVWPVTYWSAAEPTQKLTMSRTSWVAALPSPSTCITSPKRYHLSHRVRSCPEDSSFIKFSFTFFSFTGVAVVSFRPGQPYWQRKRRRTASGRYYRWY